MRRPVALLLATVLTGCATYAPAPLADRPAPPVTAAALARDGLAIDRPWLSPVAIDLSKPLDANAIAVLAVIANPDLKALRARAGVSDAQAFAARLLPDPSFSIGANTVIAGPDPLLDLAGALGFDLAALRTRGVRLAQAEAQGRQVRLDLAWSEWQTAGQARIQAIRILSLERALGLARASADTARSLLDRTMRAAGRGDVAGSTVQASQVGAADALARLRTAERDFAAARFELTRLLGLSPATTLTLATTSTPPNILDVDRLVAVALAQRADLQALHAGYDAQEAAVRKAILDQFPSLSLTVNGARDSAGNTLLGPAIAFNLPLWNRNRGGIAVEQSTRAALAAEYEARLFQTRAQIAAAVAGIGIARRQLGSAQADLPALRRFADASARAAARGDIPRATAETAAQALRDRELVAVQAEQDWKEQAVALELLTGTPASGWSR
ncbi:TolC family protein [Sphingomonas donggukensis]|uniref:TolC family protein n=1 Tax=Sphingomonas donggukensis TaxID=2949093 RepID=A0ABY4TR51_9SPHN|nr:TolC family protein [Sphingomonas donggukensis]URW74865.1 TolC family protein [Sphingomonas donggukensis]